MGKREKKALFNFLALALIIALVLLFYFSNIRKDQSESTSENYNNSDVQTSENEKIVCGSGYINQNDACVLLDSDSDGLSDLEEQSIGTNPYNPNTDWDRYTDFEDKEPNQKNSAKLSIKFENQKFAISSGIAFLALGIGTLNPDLVIANISADMIITNDGDDYTSFWNADAVVSQSSTIIKTFHFTGRNLYPSESIREKISYEVKLIDIPSNLVNAIKNRDMHLSFGWSDLSYESF